LQLQPASDGHGPSWSGRVPKSADAITEGGKPLSKAAGVKFVRMEGDRAVLEVEARSYRFGATAK